MRFFNPVFSRRYYRCNNNYFFIPRIRRREVINVTGVWDTNYGRHIMIQKGNKVTGYYHYDDGILNGIIDGNTLTGNWYEENGEGKIESGGYKLEFTMDDFVGKWGYDDKPLYYSWNGYKVSSHFIGLNCCRYRVQHDSPELSEVVFNDERIDYGQKTSYFYPEKCLPYVYLELYISNEIIEREIPVEPGYSYNFSVQGTLPDIKIDVNIENPF